MIKYKKQLYLGLVVLVAGFIFELCYLAVPGDLRYWFSFMTTAVTTWGVILLAAWSWLECRVNNY